MRLVDCNGLGGAMSLGFIQNQFDLVHKCGSLSLGIDMMLGNRPLVGWDWDPEFSDDPTEWYVPADVEVVVGSPPCSGFSTMTRKDFRGVDAKVNVHIENFGKYVGRVKPKIAAFESVQVTYSKGRELLSKVHAQVERDSGIQYHLYHVLHNALSVGGAANRPRYFWVISQVPFGIEFPEPDLVPTFTDTIGDLGHMDMTWEKQPYRLPETWWSSRRRSPDGSVDGHQTRDMTHSRRIHALVDALDGEWPNGWKEEDAARAVYARYGKLPDEWASQEAKLVANNFTMGINQLQRWHGDRPCRVITGSALSQAMHPTETRLFTHREAARIQGFPDNWRLWPTRDKKSIHLAFGKGVPVDASRWLGYWIKRSLEGDPGTILGQPDGERESVMRVDKGFKKALARGGRRRHEFWAV